jgi:hypothetical protein
MEASTQSRDGQAPGGTPTSSDEPAAADRKVAAEAAKLEEEAKKAAVDAKKAERDLKFPAPTSKPLEGKLEVADGTGLIADLLTHALVDEGARETANEIDEMLGNCARVLLVSDPELALGDWSHGSVRLSLDAYRAAFREAKDALDEALDEPLEVRERGAVEVLGVRGGTGISTRSRPLFAMPAVGPAVAVASALAGGVADVAAWFQADYSVKKRDVTVGETPLLSALAGHLVSADRSIEVDGFSLLADSPLLESFATAIKDRNELEARSAEAKAHIVDPVARKREIESAARKENASAIAKTLSGKKDASQHELLLTRETKLVDSLKELDANGAAAAAATATAHAAIASFDKLAVTLTAAGKEGAYPPLLAAALHERLHSEQDPHTHVLYAGLESVAGETISKRSLFTGTSIRYIGGAQLSYMLLDVKANAVVAAKTQPLLATTKLSLRFGSRGRFTRIRFHKPPQWGLR